MRCARGATLYIQRFIKNGCLLLLMAQVLDLVRPSVRLPVPKYFSSCMQRSKNNYSLYSMPCFLGYHSPALWRFDKTFRCSHMVSAWQWCNLNLYVFGVLHCTFAVVRIQTSFEPLNRWTSLLDVLNRETAKSLFISSWLQTEPFSLRWFKFDGHVC